MRKTEYKFQKQSIEINYGDKLCFLGSCFSEHISEKLQSLGFDVDSNPLGVLFNPISISKLISDSDLILRDESFLLKDDIHLNWFANSKIYGYESKDEFHSFLKSKLNDFRLSLSNSKVLFVSLGTSFVYSHNELNIDVANCHKIEANKFTKRLLSVSEMYEHWEKTLCQINQINPSIQVVFTVSPVRHVKDGLVENNRSKARLFELISLLEKGSSIAYFPAYEIVNDELRDYAYFKADGVHPNAFAIERVWELFEEEFFNERTKELKDKFSSFLNFFNHKSIHPESGLHKKSLEKNTLKFKSFLEENKEIIWHKKRLLQE